MIAADLRIWPPLNLPHIELGQYRERFEASYASAWTFHGVAYEDCKAAKGVLDNLQRDGGSVSQAVWKRLEEAESAFRSADSRGKEMRRCNETHWLARVGRDQQVENALPKLHVVGSNPTFKISCNDRGHA